MVSRRKNRASPKAKRGFLSADARSNAPAAEGQLA